MKNNFEQIIVNAYHEGLKDPLGPLLAYHGAVAGDGKEVNYESKPTSHDIGRCGTNKGSSTESVTTTSGDDR